MNELDEQGLFRKTLPFLRAVASHAGTDFVGLGILAYTRLQAVTHCDLRPGYRSPSGLVVGSPQFEDYLVNLARPDHIAHDGFVFFNRDGVLTHVAQYFVPPFAPDLRPDGTHGVRAHSALCGSLLTGVLFTAVICSNRDILTFRGGVRVMDDDDLPRDLPNATVATFSA
jgi:hypothetical protein